MDKCKLLQEWTRSHRLLANSKSQRRYLLECRKFGATPQHIQNLSRKFFNIRFHSNSCKKKFQNFMKYFATKLLNLEIRDINYHIKFIEKKSKSCKGKNCTFYVRLCDYGKVFLIHLE